MRASTPFLRKNIAGQTIVIHSHFLYIWLRRGPFRSAGKKFRWAPPAPGLGVNIDILRYAQDNNLLMRIFVGQKEDRCYETHPDMFLAWGTLFTQKRASLRLLPWSKTFFETVYDFPKEVLEALKYGKK